MTVRTIMRALLLIPRRYPSVSFKKRTSGLGTEDVPLHPVFSERKNNPVKKQNHEYDRLVQIFDTNRLVYFILG